MNRVIEYDLFTCRAAYRILPFATKLDVEL